MTVSAIIPSHGHRRFLPKRLVSITAQSHPPDELIIIDDGSQDGSAEWLQAWRSAIPLQLECRPVAGGNPFATWNAGVARARGDWLWIAESDDSCRSEFLATLLAAAARTPDAAIVFCQSELVDDDGRSFGTYVDYIRSYNSETWAHDFVLEGRIAARLLLARNTIPNVSACLISRRAWEAVGGADTSMSLCGDWVTYARLLQQGSLVYCARPLNLHRHHPNTQRARTARTEFVRQCYTARSAVVALHRPDDSLLEFARRQACNELFAQMQGAPETWPEQLSPETLAAIRTFDPDFDHRLRDPAARHCDHCDAFAHPEGRFSESNQRRLPVLHYGVWKTYAFRRVSGRVRFDPLPRPGRVLVRRVAALDPDSDDVYWSCDASNGFAGWVAGPGVTIAQNPDHLEVSCPHDDPQLFFPPRTESPAGCFDLVLEMLCPME